MDFLNNNFLTIIGGGSSAIALWLLKRIPNEDIYSWVETGSYWAGTMMTLGLAKWRLTRKLWNATIEPYFVDLVNNTVGAAVNGFIKGLKSDN
tara:strand:- start:944 stop:1222 length:279 start_codon:yes stop_codon:yes gene_type:complete